MTFQKSLDFTVAGLNLTLNSTAKYIMKSNPDVSAETNFAFLEISSDNEMCASVIQRPLKVGHHSSCAPVKITIT